SSPRSGSSAALRRTAPSCSNGSSLLAAPPTTHDVSIRRLVLLASAVAEGRHSPRRHRMAARGRRAFAAAVGVVDRVHRRPTRLWPRAHVALASGLSDLDVLMVGIADHPDGGPALRPHD